MSQKLLHHPQISAGFPGQRGEGMAAAMGGQMPDGRLRLPQLAEEVVIVTGEIPGVKKRPVLGAEQELPLVRQMLQTIGKLRQQRHRPETGFRLGFALLHTDPVPAQVYSTVDGEDVSGNVFRLDAQRHGRRAASKVDPYAKKAPPDYVSGEVLSQELYNNMFCLQLSVNCVQ